MRFFWATVVVPLALSLHCSPNSVESTDCTENSSTAPSTTSSSEALPQEKNNTCVGLDDGHYPLDEGCSQSFRICVANEAFTMICPANLVFNPKKRHCDRRTNVPQCDKAPVAVEPSKVGTSATPEATSTAESLASSSATLPESWESQMKHFCIKKEDGQYNMGTGCYQSFIICASHEAHFMKCPYDLVFNPRKRHCDKKENVYECEGVQVATTETSSNATYVPVTHESWEKLVDTFCHQREDGNYTIWGGCFMLYMNCANGTTEIQTCPRNQALNQEIGKCDDRKNMKICDAGTGSSVADFPYYNTLKLRNSCISEKDGQYAHSETVECSQSFRLCLSNVAYFMKCPDGLIFNPQRKHCDKKKNIPQCGRIVRDPVTNARLQREMEFPTEARYETVFSDWYRLEHSFCQGKKNGRYTLWDCSNLFVTCTDGQFMMRDCENLVFNPKTGDCDTEQNVKMCNYIPTTTVPTTTTTQAQEIQDKSETCLTKGRGLYPTDYCSSKFIACVDSKAYVIKCPYGLVFDAEIGECYYREKVRLCQETATTTTTQDPETHK